MTWVDATTSNTTNRNTSRFVLLSPIVTNDKVNFQPAFRSAAANARGGGFYWTASDPIAYHTSGESTI